MIRHQNGMFIHRGTQARQDVDVLGEVMRGDGYRTKELPIGPGLVIDIGAHIGSFATMWKQRDQSARLICVELHWDNIEILRANVGSWAKVVHGACTYEAEFDVASSIFPTGTATGGSFLMPKGTQTTHLHVTDHRPVATFTLEELAGDEDVHILKLDCEGSEYSILANTTLLPRTRYVIGEFHGKERWEAERESWFGPNWEYRLIHEDTGQGAFIYENRDLQRDVSADPPRSLPAAG